MMELLSFISASFIAYTALILLFTAALSKVCSFILFRLGDHKVGDDKTSEKKEMLLIGHRGYSALFPDNSLQSFENAINIEADGIEVDVRLTLDDKLICCHDPKILMKSSKGETAVIIEESFSSDITSKMNFHGLPTYPMLEEVFQLCYQRIGIILLDVKTKNPKVIQKIFEVGNKYSVLNQMIIGVRDTENLEKIITIQNDFGSSVKGILGFWSDPDDFMIFFEKGGTIFRLWQDDVTHSRVDSIHKLGFPVWVCSGTPFGEVVAGDIDGASLRNLKDIGVDAVLVNDPKNARAELLKTTFSCCH